MEHLAGVVHVRVITVAGILLVSVEPIIIRRVQQVGSRGGKTLDGVRVFLVLGLVVLQEVEGRVVCEKVVAPARQLGR